MLIENVLPHCIKPACKIFLFKAVVFSKVFVPGFLLQHLVFKVAEAVCFVFYALQKERVSPDKINLVNPDFSL